MIYVHWIFIVLYVAVIVGIMLTVLMDNRQPAKTIAWVLVLLFVPVVGIVLYIFFGFVLLGLGLLAVPVSARMPEEGLIGWFRSAIASVREPAPVQGESIDVDIEDLLTDDPAVPGYVTPDQLKGRARDLRHAFSR